MQSAQQTQQPIAVLEGILPAVLILILIGDSFFQAIGSDLYQKAKEKVVKAFKKKEKPTLEFRVKYKNTEISIGTTINDEKILQKVFDTIDKARELAVCEIDKKETPEMTDINLGYDEGWKLIDGQNLNYNSTPKVVKFYKYNKETGKWELTQDLSNFINAYFQAKDAKS